MPQAKSPANTMRLSPSLAVALALLATPVSGLAMEKAHSDDASELVDIINSMSVQEHDRLPENLWNK